MSLTLICRKLHSAWYNRVEDFICQLSLFHQQVLLFLWEMQQRFKGKKKSGYCKAIFLAGVVYNPSDKKAALLPTTWYQKLKLTKGSWYLGKT